MRLSWNTPRWRKTESQELANAETWLRERERYCVAASARFLELKENPHLSRCRVWRLLNEEKSRPSALLIQNRSSLFPVFGFGSCIPHNNTPVNIPGPRFLSRFLGKVNIHSVHGLKEDAELLESLMEEQGYFAAERIEYHLMSLDIDPFFHPSDKIPETALRQIPGLVLRKPEPKDEEQLFKLQAVYEQEEVLAKKSVFNPAACRLGLSKLLQKQEVLVSQLDGQVVGKINTSAASFTRLQIGGVFVRPDYRGLGIGAAMSLTFTQKLLEKGKGLTLFVKKRNIAAQKIYKKAGFSVIADYRISYY